MKTALLNMWVIGSLALPGLLGAQDRQHHDRREETQAQGLMQMGHSQGMMGMSMMIQPGPDFLLKQKEALTLSDEQVQRLEELKEQHVEFHQAHMGQLTPLRQQAMGALHAEQPDLEAYEFALNAWANEHVKMQVEMARSSQKVLEVLTEEQRSNVRYGMHLMHQWMEGMQQGQMTRCGMMQGGTMDTKQEGGH